jgi:hypothetical protein
MRKAIQLRVVLWIEGEDEPAHNFAQLTTEAVREIVAAGAKCRPELKVTVKRIVEDNSDDEDEPEEEE